MNARSLVWYLLSAICIIIAIFFLIKSLDWRSAVILVFGVAAVFLFRQGIVESKKK
jgi:uncharacterized membrane protein